MRRVLKLGKCRMKRRNDSSTCSGSYISILLYSGVCLEQGNSVLNENWSTTSCGERRSCLLPSRKYQRTNKSGYVLDKCLKWMSQESFGAVGFKVSSFVFTIPQEIIMAHGTTREWRQPCKTCPDRRTDKWSTNNWFMHKSTRS